MPTAGYNILGDDAIVLVEILVDKIHTVLREIISDEIKIRVSRPYTTYSFPCLITKLCRVANVLEVVGVDD